MSGEHLSDAEYERLTLEFWRRRVPGADSVSFTVRKEGEVVRFVRLAADGTVTGLPASSSPARPAS